MDQLLPKLKDYTAEIRKRHRKCPYARIFNYYCPLLPSPQNHGFDGDGAFLTQSEDEDLPAPKRRKGDRRSAQIQISPGTYTLSYALKYFDVCNSTSDCPLSFRFTLLWREFFNSFFRKIFELIPFQRNYGRNCQFLLNFVDMNQWLMWNCWRTYL